MHGCPTGSISATPIASASPRSSEPAGRVRGAPPAPKRQPPASKLGPGEVPQPVPQDHQVPATFAAVKGLVKMADDHAVEPGREAGRGEVIPQSIVVRGAIGARTARPVRHP